MWYPIRIVEEIPTILTYKFRGFPLAFPGGFCDNIL